MKHIIRKISALLLIIFISIIAIKGFYGRNPENIQSEHYRYFEIDLPSNASDIHIYEPKFYSRWKDDFVIIRYTIPGKEIDYFKKECQKNILIGSLLERYLLEVDYLQKQKCLMQ